jgi:serine phosphatase RsbU (regulator of sigma subunit)
MNCFKKEFKRSFILQVLLACCSFTAWSQKNESGSFLFKGVVYGYNDAPSKKLFKKNKAFTIEGLLSEVTVTLYNKDQLIRTKITDENGEFDISIPANGIFKLQLSKEGYEKNILLINTRAIPENKIRRTLVFTGAEFMLNSNTGKATTSPPVLGILYYNTPKGHFEFLVSQKGAKRADNSLELIQKAVLKNNNFYSQSSDSDKPPEKKNGPDFPLSPEGIENISPEAISLRRNEIEKSKAKLVEDKKHAVSQQDSLVIDAKETVIRAAEIELQNALKLIEAQKSEISSQKRGLYAILGFLVLLACSSCVLYVYYRDKKNTNQLLAAQNRNIVDSITYAKRIQQSILIEEEEIKKVLPDFFIFYQPKDIVSGDFYWFSNMNNTLVIAVIDCTGHGVPGAFMSLIANTLLNELVNEKRIHDPAAILQLLHKGITEALHKGKDNTWSYDGMDMGLCVIEENRKKLHYAGAMQPLYIVKRNTLEVIKADMYSIGGRKLKSSIDNERNFTTHTVEIEKSMSFYMFSDGYIDQFGEKEKNRFGTERFKKILLHMQRLDMEEQKKTIQRTMNEWQGPGKQTDDILVVGMKV